MELNGTIFLQVFIFLSLLLWLSRTLFAPIMRLFDERELRIEGSKKIALELSSLADEKAAAFQLEYDKARMEARQVLAEQKQLIDKEYTESLEKVKACAREKLLAADADLRGQEKLISDELQGKVAGLANDIVSAMVRQRA